MLKNAVQSINWQLNDCILLQNISRCSIVVLSQCPRILGEIEVLYVANFILLLIAYLTNFVDLVFYFQDHEITKPNAEVLPRVPKTKKNCTSFYLGAKFSVKDACRVRDKTT